LHILKNTAVPQKKESKMAKSTKRKFLSFLNLLILFVLFFCLNGCGNKEDAITPTTGTGRQIALSGSPPSLAAGQTSILTAKVTNSLGAAVIGATVSFELVTNNSTGTVVALNGGITDAGGQTLALYTAGATNPTADVQDTVQASVAGAMGVVTITRTAVTGGLSLALNGTMLGLSAGQQTTISATVRDDSNNPVSGATVIFDFITGGNISGATVKTLAGGVTDSDGKAYATYTAGSINPTIDVQDVIKGSASFDGYSATSSVIVLRQGTP